MKKIFSLVAAAGICASSAMAAVVYEPETEFKTIEELTASGGFAIINKTDGKALYGSNAQNLAYDVYEKAFVDTNSGYKWRLNADAGDGNYYLQLLTPAGADYNCWGMGGVLNSQGEPQGWACSFILGLSGEQKGQDIPNGACYTLAYSADNAGWSIRNVGTGQYQGFNNGPAHSDDPSYFQFVSLKKTEVADPVEEEIPVIASLASIIENGTTFLLNSADKYLYGSDNQNAAWTGDYVTAKAASNKVNQFKLEYITAGGKYLFHAYNEGNEVTIYGATPCYLNSQPAANGVIFIMGKDQDGKDGSSWKIAEVEGGYTIQNVANGAYLTSNGLSAEPAVFTIVADIPVASVALGEDFEMTVGDAAKTLTATILPENASSKTLTWSSSDTKVATVANGVVTAIGAGEAEIIAAANNGKADTVKVTVKAASLADSEGEEVVKNEKYLNIFSQDYESDDAVPGFTSPNAGGSLIIETDTINKETINKFMGYDFKATNNSTNSRGAYMWFGAESKLEGITDYIVSVDINALVLPNNQTASWSIFGVGSGYASNNVNYGPDGGKPVYLSLIETAANAETYTVRIGAETLADQITLKTGSWYTVKQVVNETAGTIKTFIGNDTITVLDVTTDVDFAVLGKVKGLYLISGRYLGAQGIDNIEVKAPMSKMKVQTLAVNYEDGELGAWVSPNAGGCLLVETDSITQNKFFSYDFHDTNTNTNSRGAYLWFNIEEKLESAWSLSFDMSADYLPNNQTAQWNVFGTNSGYASNNVNYGADGGKPVYLSLIETAANAETYTVRIGTETLAEPITIKKATWYTVKQEVTENSIHTFIGNDTLTALNVTVEVGSETVGKLKGLYLISGRYYGKQNIDNILVETAQPKITVDAFSEDYETAETTGWTSPNAGGSLIFETDTVNTEKINRFMGYDFKATNNSTNSRGAYMWFGCEEKLVGLDEYTVSVDINALVLPNNQTASWSIFGANSGYASNNVNYGPDGGKPVFLSLTETAANAETYTVRIGTETLADNITLKTGSWYTVTQTIGANSIHTVIGNDTITVLDVTSEVGFETIGHVKGLYLISGRYLGAQGVDNIKVSYVTYGETCDDPVIKVVGNTYDVNTVTIACATEGSTILYTLGADTLTYTEPFYVTENATVTAWAFTEAAASYPVSVDVVAGIIATPTYAQVASNGGQRWFTMADATPAAVINYAFNGGEFAVYSDTLTVTSTTEVAAVATRQSEVIDSIVYASDTLFFTINAGNTIQLNPVSVVKVSDSDTAWVFVVDNSSADLIGKPETQISYEVYPSGEKADVAHGDTLTFATHQRITLVANAEGYATSEPMIVWTREPAKLELVWSDDYQTIAEEKTGAGNSYGVVLKDPTFSVGGYDLCPVQVADDYVSNENFGVQSGTSWLQRNVNGYIGLYNYNSGPRRFGINNLRKTQVVKLTVQDPAQVFLDNDVLQLDETNSTANTLYYNCVKDGAALLNMSRYYCIWKVEVFNNPDVTASPNIYIAGKEGDARNVAIIPATVAYPVNQFTYYAISNGTRVDSTLVKAATDSTEAVYQVDTVTVFNDFAPIAGEFTVSKPNNTVIAYTEYEGKASEVAQVEIDCDSIYSLLLPTIAWNEKTAEGHVFTINNPNPIKSGLYPQLKVAYNGQSDIEYCNESLDCTVAGSGWLTVQAILPGMDTAYVVSRYVAEARESYNENYDAIIDGDTLTAGAYVGDIEIAAGAAVSGTYPTKAIAVTGTQFFHVAATEYFSAVTLPFAFTPGKNIVTDAKGNELVAGEDYEIATLHNLANGNVPTGKDAANVANFTNMAGCVRTSDLTAGTAILFRALSEKVGAEVILVSDAKKPVAVAVTATTMPTSGWKIYGNKRMQNVALENSVYVLNAAGDKLVLTENPTIAPMGVALMAEAATVQALGNEILLVGDPSAIDVVEDAISQFEVNTVYDLQGRQVETLKKGQVYLINGRRYMVK